ncbi:hypothetical protein [Micavibrio aeruginosavorus]|uniref:hypothetical protein n=1 Tax=Micavibrio aeruginosavorus TaxID=349221 RepID=UPI003F4AC6BD
MSDINNKSDVIKGLLDIKGEYLGWLKDAIDECGGLNVRFHNLMFSVHMQELDHALDLVVHDQPANDVKKILDSLVGSFNKKAIDEGRSDWSGKPGAKVTPGVQLFETLSKKTKNVFDLIGPK